MTAVVGGQDCIRLSALNGAPCASVLQVLTTMLSVAANVEQRRHAVSLEWIVVWLVLLCGVIALFQLAGLSGFIGNWHPHGGSQPGRAS